MKITPLNITTEYSFNKSAIRIKELIKKAKKKNISKLVICDRNSMFGVSQFINLTTKNDIIPIIGVDLDVENLRFILLAKNHNGYIEINELVTLKSNNEELKISDIKSNNYFVISHHTNNQDIEIDIPNYFIGKSDPREENEVFLKDEIFLNENDRETIDILYKMNDNKVNIIEIMPLEFLDTTDPKYKQNKFIIDNCNIEFPVEKNFLPKFKNEKNISSIEYLKKILINNSFDFLNSSNDKEKYISRLRYELSIIEKMGFADYFLIIWDLCKWSKDNKITLGPGRGSAAGSLVSFFLGITEIDPIEFNLLFERFLNPNRVSMPDIDIDIEDSKRSFVIEYLFEKYGFDNVSLISTFSHLGAKSSFRDVARYFNIGMSEVNTISKSIPSEMSLSEAYKSDSNFRAKIDSDQKYEKIFQLASKIEGLPRQFSTHAAGIIISNKKITNKCATIIVNDKYNQIQMPMNYLEDHGLLKIDLLGLRNLTIINEIQDEIFINYSKRYNLKKIDLNDKKTNLLLSQGDTNGVFQLESPGMKKTLKTVGVDNFNDLVAIISLFRPGPMDMIPEYNDVKKGIKPFPSISPEYDRITKETNGIIIYQEQIMEIAQAVSGMSFAQADILRRAISKKENNLIVSLKKEFIDGALSNDYDIKTITKIYLAIEKFANYGFNKSHGVAYGVLAYRLAFLKARYKFEFYTALLSSSISSQATSKKYIYEAQKAGIKVISPSINLSQEKVINKGGEIILSFQLIKGIGQSAANKIILERKKGLFVDFIDFIVRSRLAGIGDGTIDALIYSNSLREFGNIETLKVSLSSAIKYANVVITKKDEQIIVDKTIMPKPFLIKEKIKIKEEILFEKKLLGFQMNSFITKGFETKNKLIDYKTFNNTDVTFLIGSVNKYTANNGNNYYKVMISDSTFSIKITIFNNVAKYLDNIKAGKMVKGKLRFSVNNNYESIILTEKWEEIQNE